MNILVFAHDSSMYGASQSLLTAVLGMVTKKNRKVMVLLPYPGKIELAFDNANIEYRIIPFPRCVELKTRLDTVVKRIKYIYKYYRKFSNVLPLIRNVVLEFQPDVIYSNTSAVSIGYVVSKQFKIPHVWHVREFAKMDFLYYPTHRHVAKGITRSTSSIFYSNALKKSWLGSTNGNGKVIYNGIYDSSGEQYSARQYTLGKFNIGLLGSILPVKGQDIAIKALPIVLERVPQCTLLVYGDFVDELYGNKLKTLVKSLRISDKVFFKEFNSDKDMVYSNIDVLLNCTISDGFGRTVVEAMIRGIPVIATNAGGIDEIIENEMTGLSYNGTPQSLADSIIKVLSNEKLYNKLAINGIENAKKYSILRYQEGINEILCAAGRGSKKRKV